MHTSDQALAEPGRIPELLVPAGSTATFLAAIQAGADAVYLGLPRFNARASSQYIDREALARSVLYAHERKVKVIVACNTLIKEQELEDLVDELVLLQELRVDAVIVQDMGVARLIREAFPDLRLHASTQMTIHNLEGVEEAGRMGFRRVVLARELTLNEIAWIRKRTRMELEVFVHGAMCYCMSGQCIWSTLHGGQSANRGRCAQTCRRTFMTLNEQGVAGPGQFLFSMADLKTLSLIPRLKAIGVDSLKIEGRLKDVDYITGVASAYRRVLDASEDQLAEVMAAAEQRLETVHTRSVGSGYLCWEPEAPLPASLINVDEVPSVGRYIGRVEHVARPFFSVRMESVLETGGRVRLFCNAHDGGISFALKGMRREGHFVQRAVPGDLIEFMLPEHLSEKRVRKGDWMHEVTSVATMKRTEELAAEHQRLLAGMKPRVQVHASWTKREGAEGLLARMQDGEVRCEYFKVLSGEPAESSPLSEDILKRHFAQTGSYPFDLGELQVGYLPPLVLKPSALKAFRREAYDVLQRSREAFLFSHKARALLMLRGTPAPVPGTRKKLVLFLDHPDLFQALPARVQQRLDHLVLPLDTLPVLSRRWKPEQLVVQLPVLVWPEEWAGLRRKVRRCLHEGYTQFMLANPGQLLLFRDASVRLWGHPCLNLINHQACSFWKEQGLDVLTLSPECDMPTLEAMARTQYPVERMIMVWSARHVLFMARGQVHGIQGRQLIQSTHGEQFLIDTTGGHTLVRAMQERAVFSFMRREPIASLVSCHGLDATGLEDLSGLPDLLESYDAGRSPRGASPFNLMAVLE
jgi:U32 family peptidase